MTLKAGDPVRYTAAYRSMFTTLGDVFGVVVRPYTGKGESYVVRWHGREKGMVERASNIELDTRVTGAVQ